MLSVYIQWKHAIILCLKRLILYTAGWNNGTRCRHGINVWQFAFACMGNLSPQMFILSCKRREGGGGIGEVHMVV